MNSYIRKVIISNTVMVFLVLVSLSGMIRLVDELRKIGEENCSVFKICIYTFLILVKDFELFFSIATLIGGLLGLSVLEIHNEFVAMQVFGFSRLQIALSVIKAVIPILLFSIISNEWIVPNSEKIIYMYRSQLKHDICLFTMNVKNVWCIDNNNFVYIDHIVAYDELLGVNLYIFNEEKKLTKILYIERAKFANNVWNLINVNELDISEDTHVFDRKKLNFEWYSMLTPYKLSMIVTHPNALSISKLYHCIKYFNQIGQNSKYHQIIFWSKTLSPVSGLTMIIMALSCVFGPLYQKKIGVRLFVGSIIGFLFYILDQVFGVLSILYDVHPIVVSISPSITFLIISTIIIWKYW